MAKRLELRGKSALLTGASRGVGRELARALAAAGARLALAARGAAEREKLAAELRERAAPRRTRVAIDLRDDASVARGVERALLDGRQRPSSPRT